MCHKRHFVNEFGVHFNHPLARVDVQSQKYFGHQLDIKARIHSKDGTVILVSHGIETIVIIEKNIECRSSWERIQLARSFLWQAPLQLFLYSPSPFFCGIVPADWEWHKRVPILCIAHPYRLMECNVLYHYFETKSVSHRLAFLQYLWKSVFYVPVCFVKLNCHRPVFILHECVLLHEFMLPV